MPIHLDLTQIIETVGYLGVFFIVFAESGLFFGFFLPGDSLLFTAGFLASQGLFDLRILLISLTIAAISGDSVGYWMGKVFGERMMKRGDSWYFKKKYIYEAESFYEKHGGKAIVLARFIPVVRTFAPIVAGMARMDYSRFLTFNVFGGTFWVVGILFLGFFLGNAIPNVDKYLLPIIGVIILLSILPGLWHIRTGKKALKVPVREDGQLT